MCDSCCSQTIIGRGGYGYVVEHDKFDDIVQKCQPTYNDAPFRELIMYYHLDHPNIPKIFDTQYIKEVSKNYIHFSMKRYVPLKEYYHIIKDDIETKRKIFLDIVKAVSYLQSRNVYHQDIRSDNVLIDINTNPVTAYLVDFGLSCADYVAIAGWIDPDISEYYYTHYKAPPHETRIAGDSWSLGLFGVYLFCDDEIYEWVGCVDDETMDIVYFLKGRFGFGLEKAHLDLKEGPEDILEIIQALINRTSITNGYEYDPINMSGFNQLNTTTDKLSYVQELYGEILIVDKLYGEILIVDNISREIDEYIETTREKRIESRSDGIAIIKDLLNKCETNIGGHNKVKLVYLLYDHLLPQVYDYFKPDFSFWNTVIRKLEELQQEPGVDLSDLVERRMGELKERLDIAQKN